MARLSADPETVERNLAAIRERIARACASAGRDPGTVTLCAASKYVDAEGLSALRAAGVSVIGENRLQDLIAKQERFGEDFEWHFIGSIQSRKAAEIARRVTLIHSLATETARARLNAYEGPMPRVLVEVNASGEASKDGIEPAALAQFLAGCEFPVHGLMTMPPRTADPEAARPFFRAVSELAAEHGFDMLSMGTTQDFEVAIQEGATIVRVGSALFL